MKIGNFVNVKVEVEEDCDDIEVKKLKEKQAKELAFVL